MTSTQIDVKDYQAKTERMKVISDHTMDIINTKGIVDDLANDLLQEEREKIARRTEGKPALPKNILALLQGAGRQ